MKSVTNAPLKSEGLRGVLPDVLIKKAIAAGWITAKNGVPESNIQPASIDLRLGPVAYRLRSSFLPSKSVLESVKNWQLGPEIPLKNGAVFERNRPYLIPLAENLALPGEIRGKANPKSSTGRLDVFTRVVANGAPGFDQIPPGYIGPLFLEVVSRSFAIQVSEGLTLNQLRLVAGSQSPPVDLAKIHAKTPLLYRSSFEGRRASPALDVNFRDGLFLSVDLTGKSGNNVVGYRAKKNSLLLNLSKVREYRIDDFWEQVQYDKRGTIILEPEEFYLLVSEEGISIPPGYAGEMAPYDPTSGELRTHYAGFFDPGFGYSPNSVYGSRAVMEVRAHDVPFALEHGQKIARIELEPMAASPDKLYGAGIGSNYQNQGLRVSKHFKDPSVNQARQTGMDSLLSAAEKTPPSKR